MFRTNYQREPCACRVHATFDSEHGSPQNGQKRKTSFSSDFADTSKK